MNKKEQFLRMELEKALWGLETADVTWQDIADDYGLQDREIVQEVVDFILSNEDEDVILRALRNKDTNWLSDWVNAWSRYRA